MASTQVVFVVLFVSTTYALQVYSDYEDYFDHKREEGETKGHGHTGHWTGHQSDHSGVGHGQKQHQHHFYDHTGGSGEGSNKAGGHIKHQVTKGYQNYHHKDEVGKTTSYIDSFGDTGDHHGNYESSKGWGDHGHSGFHKDHHASGYSGQEGLSRLSYNQKKEDFNKKTEGASKLSKDEYKGDIADVIYAKKPVFQSKPFYPHSILHHVPYPYYFY